MQVINLGKEPSTKAYRLFDPINKRVYVSRDVVFDELKHWPWNRQKEEESYAGSFLVPEMHTDIEQSQQEGAENDDIWEARETTPPHSPSSYQNSDNYDDSSEPKRYRTLNDIYNNSEVVEVEDELLLVGQEEPVNYGQAVKKKGMETNGHKTIGLKWIFKLKKDADGKIVKHKAQLVAKGYAQEYGVDFDEIFAPVTRLETVRLLLALSAKNQWQVHHLDVKTAFLNGEINEEVYVAQPEGYENEGKEHLVYKLLKALYGLRQALEPGMGNSTDVCWDLGSSVALYVDNLLVTGSNVGIIEEFKKQMNSKFEMSDLGKLTYYLGIEVQQKEGYIKIKQSSYAKKILENAGMIGCNPTKYPMDPKEQLTKDDGGKTVDTTQYKSMVGGLRYLVHTRPDISYAVGIISRYMERPTVLHQNAVKRILRYIKGTLDYGQIYSKQGGNNILTLAGNIDDRRSMSIVGMVFYLNENMITWMSQKQKCVALSSCEAEFMAATAALVKLVVFTSSKNKFCSQRLQLPLARKCISIKMCAIGVNKQSAGCSIKCKGLDMNCNDECKDSGYAAGVCLPPFRDLSAIGVNKQFAGCSMKCKELDMNCNDECKDSGYAAGVCLPPFRDCMAVRAKGPIRRAQGPFSNNLGRPQDTWQYHHRPGSLDPERSYGSGFSSKLAHHERPHVLQSKKHTYSPDQKVQTPKS
ncbi:uncharacterized protein LOC141704306 [Apium graveolens]|uniref:uncharacterized protein LOC141704306 n=1 Tax=Apium graveolens TaxID=4045 RepID=UPI003D793481